MKQSRPIRYRWMRYRRPFVARRRWTIVGVFMYTANTIVHWYFPNLWR